MEKRTQVQAEAEQMQHEGWHCAEILPVKDSMDKEYVMTKDDELKDEKKAKVKDEKK